MVLNLVHKVWGEQAPTYLGVERPKEVIRWTATPHFWWSKVMALEIDRIPVRDIMVPRDRIVDASTDRSLEESLEILSSDHLSRHPLVGDSLEDYRGNLYLPAVFRRIDEIRAGEVSLEEVAAPPLTVPADLPVSRLIDRFQQERQELALVVEETEEGSEDGDRRVVGLVTVTEAFEAIAGELEDPYD